MKRCPNCGYMNLQTESVCKNCNISLDKAQSFHFPASETEILDEGSAKSTPHSSEEYTRQTEIARNQRTSSSQNPSTPSSSECEKCGYPMMNKTSVCPNCGHKHERITTHSSHSQSTEGKTRHTSKRKTLKISHIDGIDEPSASKGFTLVSIKNETRSNFKGNRIIINRRNLDQNNMSISSEKHVKIYQQGGKWFAKDLSSNGATFIQLKGEAELQSGDMIILGNKMYRFEPDH